MTKFKRVLLIVVGYLIIFASLPFLMFRDLYWHVDQTLMIMNVSVAVVVIAYNIIILYANKTYMIVVGEGKEDKEDKK